MHEQRYTISFATVVWHRTYSCMLMEMNDSVEDSQSFLFHSPNVISMLLLHIDEMEHKMCLFMLNIGL